MLPGILTVIINIIYVVILNLNLYTDRAMMPDGNARQWQRSPINRLYISDRPGLLYLQLFFVAASVITGIMMMLGNRSSTLRTIWLIAVIASAVMFVIIMIVTGNAHADYA